MKKTFTLLTFMTVALILLSFQGQAQIVTTSADDGSAGTLRSQIAAATSGETIVFLPTVNNILLTLGQITIDKNLTITGTPILNTTISGNDASRIFDITTGTVVLNSLTLTDGLADNGGAIQVANADLTINASTLNDNVANGTAGSGGAIFVSTGADLTMLNSTISNNRANRAGGGIESVAGTMLELTNVTLSANNAGMAPAMAAPGNGGGVHITGSGNAVIVGGTVSMNMAAAEGGGFWNGSGTMTITGTTITQNTASGVAADNGGGGIYNLNNGTLTINNAIITNNDANGTAGSGGGILNDVGATLTINNSTITGNTANRAGGGIEDNSGALSMVSLTNVNLNENTTFTSPGNGGGLHVTGAGTVTITGGTVNMNEAGAEGGGLWNGSGMMTIDGTTINGNTASGNGADQGGGGIYNLNGGTLNISNASITNNIADGSLGSGGGIMNDVDGEMTITDTAITGNTAVRAGGGVEDNSGTSTIIFDNVTLNNNTVTGPPGNGGGLHITGAGNINIMGGTVNNNTASLEGGGLWNGTGTMTIQNTTINGNVAQGAAADDGGGAIFNNGGTIAISDVTIGNNTATGVSGSGGGLLSLSGAITIMDTDFNANSANRAGGAIEIIDGMLTMTDVNMVNNDVDGGAGTANPGNGGGLHISGVTTTVITRGNVAENSAAREGGGLWNQTGSTMTINEVTVDGNTADGPDAVHGGGGIFNNGGSLMINRSTISNNISSGALGNGGGIHVKSGTAAIMLSTVSGNTSAEFGGGIYNNAALTINASTIAFNTVPMNGGGIYNNSATAPELKNTIVAMNMAAAGDDIFSNVGNFMSNGYNLIGQDDTNDFPSMATDIENSNPLLGPLSDNGGETLTHNLLPGSPAYNAGDPTDMFNDQTGSPVFAAIRDIGAVEAQSQLGIAENAMDSLKRTFIYPNPSIDGAFSISIAGDFGNVINGKVIEMASGKTVHEFSTTDNVSSVRINNYAMGVYIVQLVSDNFAETHKLIISR